MPMLFGLLRRRFCFSVVVVLLGCAAVASAQAVIVDNNNSFNTEGVFSVLSGSWSTGSSAAGHWESDYRYASAGGTVTSAEWRPDLPQEGSYTVSVYYPAGSNRAPDAPFTVYHDSGSTTVYVDQRVNGGMWYSLGTYDFAPGTGGYVTISDTASSGTVIADAVQFDYVNVVYDPPAFRGFWIDAFGTGFKSASQIDTMISRALAGGYNALVPEVLAFKDTSASDNGHGAYWKSSIIPWAPVVTTSFDPLAYMCQKAHQNGLQVHAWLVTYRVSSSWPPSGNGTLASHPEWLTVRDSDIGTITDVGGHYILDPGSPEAQDYIISSIQELVTNYEIDGINLDYIRYTYSDAGYPTDLNYENSSLARFNRIYGRTGVPDYDDNQWSDFRRRTINELVRRCRAEIPAITGNPRQPLAFTADLICTGGAPVTFSSSGAYSSYFQNWKGWLENGWLDAGMTMNYKDDREPSHYTWYRSWIDAAVSYSGDRHVYCGQANYLNSMANSIIQLQYVYNAGAEGSMNYCYTSTVDADDDGYGETDWSWYPYVGANLFTGIAPIPEMPWRDPTLATEGTLWGRITDYDTGNPVDDATVEVDGVGSVKTDGNGYYVVTLIPATQVGTEYEVTADGDGYADEITESVTVSAGSLARLDLELGIPGVPFDFNGDRIVGLDDVPWFVYCLSGPGYEYTSPGHFCVTGDGNGDQKVDMTDFALFQQVYQSE